MRRQAPNDCTSCSSNPLPLAVRDALHPGSRVSGIAGRLIAIALAAGIAPTASAAPFPARFELASLLPRFGGDGSAGFVLNGEAPFEGAGEFVSGAGDVNGDGIEDLVVSAPNADYEGRGYVLFGRDEVQSGKFPPVIQLASLLSENGGDGTAGFVIRGHGFSYYSNFHGAAAGDVNGDGIDDLVVGNSDYSRFGFDAGESYVVFGRDTARVGPFPAELRISSLSPDNGGDGTAGFILPGVDDHDGSGYAVSAAGDVNGDGIGDVLIGAPAADALGESLNGESYILFGRDTARVGLFPPIFPLAKLLPSRGGDGRHGFALAGIDYQDRSGNNVSNAGDVNGDGVADFMIGTNANSLGSLSRAEVYIVFGRAADTESPAFPPVVPLRSLLPDSGGDGSKGFVLKGVSADEWTDTALLASAGDVNGDGIGDMVIGIPHTYVDDRMDVGRTFVVFGRNTALVGRFPAELPLASLLAVGGGDGSKGFALNGIDELDGWYGSNVSGGDLNGDGISDIVTTAPGADPRGRDNVGETYVVYGRDTVRAGNFPPEFELADLLPGAGGDGSAGFVLSGIHTPDKSGRTVSVVGDVNGDGIGDLLIGAQSASPGGHVGAGQSYVVFGRPATMNADAH